MKRLETLFYIVIGNVFLAFAVCAFVVPNRFMLGGSTGIALAVQSWIPAPISVISAVVNVSLFLLGFVFLGKQFAMTSLLSTVIYPIILGFFEKLPVGTWFSGDTLLCAVFAGVMMGGGIGLVIRAGGSTGGMDIPPCILQKLKGIPVGNSMMAFDILILGVQIMRGGWDGILYGIVVIVLTSAMVNNYIKDGLLPRAEGKRYSRTHLAYLTAICALKQVLPVKDAGMLVGEHTGEGAQAMYARLREELDKALAATAGRLDPALGEEELPALALELALRSYADKLACQRVLDLIRRRQPEPTKKSKKERKEEK